MVDDRLKAGGEEPLRPTVGGEEEGEDGGEDLRSTEDEDLLRIPLF